MAARKVLLVADGVKLSRDSLMCAVSLCQRTAASLLVVNVVACPQEHTYWVDVHRRLVQERLETAARNIDPLLDEVRGKGVAVELVRQAGDMESVLAGLAKSEAGTLAVIAGDEPKSDRARSASHRGSCTEPFRQLLGRIEALFGCPLVAVRAKK